MAVMYQYLCSSCSYEFEELHTVAQRDEASCPKCGSSETTRSVGYSGQFKVNGYSEANGYSGILGHDKDFINQFGKQ
jgi:putative FmdB family regulatory protein